MRAATLVPQGGAGVTLLLTSQLLSLPADALGAPTCRAVLLVAGRLTAPALSSGGGRRRQHRVARPRTAVAPRDAHQAQHTWPAAQSTCNSCSSMCGLGLQAPMQHSRSFESGVALPQPKCLQLSLDGQQLLPAVSAPVLEHREAQSPPTQRSCVISAMLIAPPRDFWRNTTCKIQLMHRYISAHLLISEFFSSSSCFRSVLRLTVTLLVMLRALSANLRVLQVSSKARMEGEMVAMIMVLQLPPRESCKR